MPLWFNQGFSYCVKIVVSFILSVSFLGGIGEAAEKTDFQAKKQPEIQQVKPHKPVKIKLHRTAKGEYTWDLTGDSVDEIVKADKRLRTLLKIEQGQ